MTDSLASPPAQDLLQSPDIILPANCDTLGHTVAHRETQEHTVTRGDTQEHIVTHLGTLLHTVALERTGTTVTHRNTQ